MTNKIASTVWQNVGTVYISNLPGHGGVDWGYTSNRNQAIPLNKYWQRRFASDMQYCNNTAHFS